MRASNLAGHRPLTSLSPLVHFLLSGPLARFAVIHTHDCKLQFEGRVGVCAITEPHFTIKGEVSDPSLVRSRTNPSNQLSLTSSSQFPPSLPPYTKKSKS